MEKFFLSEIYTASTAATELGIPYSTLKDDLVRYGKFDPFIQEGLVKKEGKIWLISKTALINVYGNRVPKEWGNYGKNKGNS